MLIHDPETGRILDANEAGEDLFGYDVEALREMEVREFSPTMENVADQVETAFAKTMPTGEEALDWEIGGADGTVTEVWVELRRETIDGTEVVVTFVTDLARKVKAVLETVTEPESAALKPISLVDAVATQIDRAESATDRVRFEADLPETCLVRANDRLDDVVGNLLMNAFEHTEG